MNNEKIEVRILDALRQQQPMPPVRHELGGGYYYTCYWLTCNNTVSRYQEYCDQCGQKILWEDK